MQAVTWDTYLNLLKVLNCTSKEIWRQILNVDSWNDQGEFEHIWTTYKRMGLFHALCALDSDNLKLMMDYAVRETITHG